MPVRSAVIMALLCLFITVPALADNGYNPGFRTLGFWQQESGIRVDVNVWYPSVRAPRSLSYAPWTIRGARNGKPVPGRFPLILLSHPSSGTRFSFHDTAAALAARGFVVAAPTHPRDCMENMDHLFLWEQLKDRALELSATMDLLLADKDIGPSIDPKRIGVLGYGSGATAALLLGGYFDEAPMVGYIRQDAAGGAFPEQIAGQLGDDLVLNVVSVSGDPLEQARTLREELCRSGITKYNVGNNADIPPLPAA